jgi:hypothetical protein
MKSSADHSHPAWRRTQLIIVLVAIGLSIGATNKSGISAGN